MEVRSSRVGIEDYLTTIYRLEEIYGFAKTTKISRELNVTPATVSKVINYLETKGYVRRVKYRGVTLTSRGREVAEEIVRKHRIAEAFLTNFLGFDIYEAHLYAHRFEHLPREVIDRIYERMGMPLTCPHGNHIPGAKALTTCSGIRLSEAAEGRWYTIVRIGGELIHALKVLKELGLGLSSSVKVVVRKPLSTVIELSGGGLAEIPNEVAETVYVGVGGG